MASAERRHTLGTWLQETIGDARLTAETLGHRGLGSVSGYTKITDARRREAYEEMQYAACRGARKKHAGISVRAVPLPPGGSGTARHLALQAPGTCVQLSRTRSATRDPQPRYGDNFVCSSGIVAGSASAAARVGADVIP